MRNTFRYRAKLMNSRIWLIYLYANSLLAEENRKMTLLVPDVERLRTGISPIARPFNQFARLYQLKQFAGPVPTIARTSRLGLSKRLVSSRA
jgi:hypothetical protein